MKNTTTPSSNASSNTSKSTTSSTATHRFDISPELIIKLIDNRQIKVLPVQACNAQIQREHASLKRLQHRLTDITSSQSSKKTNNQLIMMLLNLYDQLFRHMCLGLLSLGYGLTKVRPHQTLILISEPYSRIEYINQMVKTRHQLKKGHSNEINSVAVQTLERLLKRAGAEDWQACHILIKFVNKLSYY